MTCAQPETSLLRVGMCFLDDGTKAEFWVVTDSFCCLAVDTGPVIPSELLGYGLISFALKTRGRCVEKLVVLGNFRSDGASLRQVKTERFGLVELLTRCGVVIIRWKEERTI